MIRRGILWACLALAGCSYARAAGNSGYDSMASLTSVTIGQGFSGAGTAASPLVSVVSTYTIAAAGTVYSLTTTTAAVTFGTTSPSVTIGAAGTYLLIARANVKYNAATFAANQTARLVLRRTNNTAAYVTTSETNITLRIITTITDDVGVLVLPPQIYTTTTASDIIALWGNLTAAPAAGSVDVNEATITVVRLF